jgi:magnesium chelatase family protein
MLIAAMNPCPCGYLTDSKNQCRCTYQQVHRYRSKISGPLLDRIDLHVDVPAVPYNDLVSKSNGENSADIRNRVHAARSLQVDRYQSTQIFSNAQMNSRQLKRFCSLDTGSRHLLETVIDKFGLSARAYNRILKIARTIADLADQESITMEHVSEAVQFRSLDRRRKPGY